MKKLILIFTILYFSSCTKNTSNDWCGTGNGTAKTGKCYDKIPDGTVCQAYWESWFYNEATKTCEKRGYSGCNKLGCETEQECEDCANGITKSMKSGQVLRFNFEKCGCCWGFVVKVENIEYIINDQKIFNLIDYTNITQPINIELEFGERNLDCQESVIHGLTPATIKEFKLK
jgi:hypothetical protein